MNKSTKAKQKTENDTKANEKEQRKMKMEFKSIYGSQTTP